MQTSPADAIATPSLTPPKETKLPSLDGLRAISILLVVFAHCNGTRGFPLDDHRIGDLGSLGVRVFFVISGFLITSLLLQELREIGRIDLLRFYARRSVRIFPACYLYILTVAILAVVGSIQLVDNDLAFAATYTMNYHRPHGWHLGHLWSLAVEEQFYLLWPFILALAGVRRGLWVAAAAVALCPVFRMAMIHFFGTDAGLERIFPNVADSLATGCLLAGLRGRLEAHGGYSAMLRSPLFYALPLVILATNVLLGDRPRIIAAVGATFMNISVALCIHHWVVHPGDRVGRWLNSRGLVALGVLSYSLYLWQQLFLNRASDAWCNRFPVNVLLAFAAAWASYRLVEKPLMGLRKRLHPRAARAMPG